MAIKAVNNWLNGEQDYTEGVRLFTQYGSSKVLANLFASSQNSYTVKKLLQEMQQLNTAQQPVTVAVKEVHPKKRQKDVMRLSSFKLKNKPTFGAVDLSNAPKAIQSMDQRRRQLFQQAAEVKAALDGGQFTTPEERYKAVKLIDDNFYGHRGIQQIWHRIDFWHKWGRVVPFHTTQPKVPVHREALRKRLTTVRTYVSRYKTNPEKQHLHSQYMQELMDIEQKLIDNAAAE